MKARLATAIATLLMAGAAANATPVLQMDVNAFHIQAVNGGGGNIAFGGLTHTGAVQFSMMPNLTVLNGISIRSVANGPFVDQGFSGTLSSFTGQVNLVNGQVTGGNITVAVNGGTDTYTTTIAGGSGAVSIYVGGGFKIEGLTSGGFFSDASYGNVSVAPWFAAQGGNGLLGSFLQFNFNPDAGGGGFSDMDLFVDVVPIPPAVYTGMATMAGAIVIRRLRRR